MLLGGWNRERLARFEEVLGPLEPTSPILDAIGALQGHYDGKPVWIFRTRSSQEHRSFTWLAMSVGSHPLHGYILDDRLRDLTPVEDDAFFDVFKSGITPAEVAPRALDTPEARAAVQRLGRGSAGTAVHLSGGFLWATADYSAGFLSGRLRPAELEEVRELVADVSLLAERFRVAFETVHAEIAQTDGAVAAQAWVDRAQQHRDREANRGLVLNMIGLGLVLAMVGIILLGALSISLLLCLI